MKTFNYDQEQVNKTVNCNMYTENTQVSKAILANFITKCRYQKLVHSPVPTSQDTSKYPHPPQWHNVHTKFHPNPSSGPRVESFEQTDMNSFILIRSVHFV